MFLSIRHTTTYSYNEPIVLEPHTIRLTPRADSYRRLMERTLTIIPEPDGLSMGLDANESLTHLVWFKRKTNSLSIVSRLVLELNESNPFDYIVHPLSCLHLPMTYPADQVRQLKSFMQDQPVSDKVMKFAIEVMEESKFNVLEFVSLLARRVRELCAYEIREHGEPYSADKVLSLKRGSCRDLAVLYIEAARAVGLAARFVSGYYFDQDPKHPQLHAWVEVYIPGGGWRGFDPTIGLACYGHHIVLAAAAVSSQTAAVEGSFLGSSANQMEARLEYEYIREPFRSAMY